MALVVQKLVPTLSSAATPLDQTTKRELEAVEAEACELPAQDDIIHQCAFHVGARLAMHVLAFDRQT